MHNKISKKRKKSTNQHSNTQHANNLCSRKLLLGYWLLDQNFLFSQVVFQPFIAVSWWSWVTYRKKRQKIKKNGKNWNRYPDLLVVRIKAPTHCPDSNQQPTAFIRPLCCLLSDLFGRKVALNTPLRHAASSTVVCTFCACARCNKWVALHENRKWGNGVHRKTKRTQYSAPPTHRTDLLEHCQSEWSYS